MKKLRVPGEEIRRILADNIVCYRRKKSLSQEAFAEICGFHRTYIGSIERGERNVTLSTLEALAKVMETTIPDLLTFKGEQNNEHENGAAGIAKRISKSGLTIYDPVEMGSRELWIPTKTLETILSNGLQGISLEGMPLRSRSKYVKETICRLLGYPVPDSFKKTKPRFPGQNFDIYVQKSNNLQIWNEELSADRRYGLIRVDGENRIAGVKVVTGSDLAILDTTGTLTQKYQARCKVGSEKAELVSLEDTVVLKPIVTEGITVTGCGNPNDEPSPRRILSISAVFEGLRQLIGNSFPDEGRDQERNRGAALHRLVCRILGYSSYHDDGQFPDIRHQLLEIKLQTSPTIDLGLIRPDSEEGIGVHLSKREFRHCDVRYAIFYGKDMEGEILLTHLIMTTGESFFTRFPQFQGKVINKKLQIPLPDDFFDR